MSSTKRGGQRHISDYYITPIDVILDFLFTIRDIEPAIFSGMILDPCAGGDVTHAPPYPSALMGVGVPPYRIGTIDIREDSSAVLRGVDFLAMPIDCSYDLVISNPPFALAEQFVRKSLDSVREGGFVVMLLRLNYFGSEKRFPLWQNQLPKYAFVHHRRISFTPDGKTDSVEYMHCVWQKGYYPDFTKLKVI